jgi:GNAT superfamily N-acetyltransferase
VADLAIISGYGPGLIGRVTQLHATYYSEHWGFGAFFEAKVASEMAEFVTRYDGTRDQILSVAVAGVIEASLCVDGLHGHTRGAHLRWFIASDQVRGSGLGARLLGDAIEFCRGKGYPKIKLWTFKGLHEARHLYEKAGFTNVESLRGQQWGAEVEEQRYEKVLFE